MMVVMSQIPDAMWCPTQLNIYKREHRDVKLVETFKAPLPEISWVSSYHNTAGFVYEIKAVREAIMAGKLLYY